MNKDEVINFLEKKENKINWFSIRAGIVMEYSDGFDVMIFNGKKLDKYADPQTVITEFKDMDSKRNQVIIALSNWLYERGIAVEYSSNGDWNLKFNDRCHVFIDVGNYLTTLLKEMSPKDSFVKMLKDSTVRTPSNNNVDRLMSLDSAMFKKREVRKAKKTYEAKFNGVSLPAFVYYMMDNRYFKKAIKLITSEEHLEFIKKHDELSYIMDLTVKLIDTIGIDFYKDSYTKGCIYFNFEDDMDSMPVDLRDIKVKRKISEMGVDVFVNKIHEKYLKLNQARNEIFELLKNTMAINNYVLDDCVYSWWFGREKRDFEFSTGKVLTLELISKTPEEVVKEWLQKNNMEPEVIDTFTPIVSSRLADTPPTILPELDSYNYSELNNDAALIIAEFKEALAKSRGNKYEIFKYWHNPIYYSIGGDVWVDDDWWMLQAGRKNVDYVQAFYGDINAWERVYDFAIKYNYLDPGNTMYEGILSAEELYLIIDEVWPQKDYCESMDEIENCWVEYLGIHFPQIAEKKISKLIDQLDKYKKITKQDEKQEFFSDIIMTLQKVDKTTLEEWLSQDKLDYLYCLLKEKVSGEFNCYDFDYGLFIVIYQLEMWDLGRIIDENINFEIALSTWYREFYIPTGFLSLCLARIGATNIAAKLAAYILQKDDYSGIAKHWFGDKNVEDFKDKLKKGYLEDIKKNKFAAAIVWKLCSDKL